MIANFVRTTMAAIAVDHPRVRSAQTAQSERNPKRQRGKKQLNFNDSPRARKSFGKFLPSWHRYDRCALFVSCVGEREEKHNKSKQSFGGEVLVVDPVPILTIRHKT